MWPRALVAPLGAVACVTVATAMVAPASDGVDRPSCNGPESCEAPTCEPKWVQGLPPQTGAVHASIVWDDGTGPAVYLVGDLSLWGPPNGLYKWVGTHWVLVGGEIGQIGGFYSEVFALAIYHGDLIAAGDFTLVDGLPAAHIARWDGSRWHALGEGSPNIILALAVYNDELFADGRFWDGSAWHTQGGVLPCSPVRATAIYHGELYAGCDYSGPVNLVKWNGASWSVPGPGVVGNVWALGVFNDELYVGGFILDVPTTPVQDQMIARWNGGNWSTVGGGVDTWVASFTVYRGSLIIGGSFYHAGGAAMSMIAAWDGAAFSPLGAGLFHTHQDSDVQTLTVFCDELFAGGYFYDVPGGQTRFWAQWAPDTDSDGVSDASDNCPETGNATQEDADADGVGDACDNCVCGPNPDQGPAVFGQMLVASAGSGFTWPTPADVTYVEGPLSGIGTYAVEAMETLPQSQGFVDSTVTAPGTGRYYLVKPDCPVGSWQNSLGAEPARDELLP